jgi:hypothetical protein
VANNVSVMPFCNAIALGSLPIDHVGIHGGSATRVSAMPLESDLPTFPLAPEFRSRRSTTEIWVILED